MGVGRMIMVSWDLERIISMRIRSRKRRRKRMSRMKIIKR